MATFKPLELPGRSKPYVMAHRGNRVHCPENTLASFQYALDEGADILETDLHLTADGVLVCIHDATVDRTTNGSGAVAEKTLAELRGLSASYGRPEFEDERIPSLQEVIRLIPPDRALALELKTDRFLEPEVGRQLIQELHAGGILERTVLLSFHLDYLQAVQQQEPQIPIGLISLSRLLPPREVQLTGVFWPVLLLNPFYARLAHRNDQVTCPLDPTPDARLRWYKRMGFDAVLSDDPGKTISLLRSLT